MINEVWVFTCETESGENYGPWLFAVMPTAEELTVLMKDRLPSEEYTYLSETKLVRTPIIDNR